MTNSTGARPPIFRRREIGPIEVAFEGDLFERQELAERVTKFIERLPDGGVFAIDAPWGDGKTWFATHWAADLDAKKFRTIYIDAFRQDYIEDSFLMLSGEILAATRREPTAATQRFADASKRIGKALLPIAAKVAVGAASRIVLGSADALGEIEDDIESKLGDAVEKHIEQRLQAYETDKKSVEHFKSALSDLAMTQERPIIVMVDELDRCRPTFAVQTIERIKHFFEVPKVVFILFLNRIQLLESIKGVYGSGIDANAYLAKFIQFSVSLPKRRSYDPDGRDHNRTYCEELLRHYGFPTDDRVGAFANVFSAFASFLQLSFRDIERGVILFSLGQPIDASAPLAGWLAALRVAKPNLFAGIVANRQEAHKEAKSLLDQFKTIAPNFWITPLLLELHAGHLNGFATPFSQDTRQMLSFMGHYISPDRYLLAVAEKLDLNVSK